MFFKSIVSMICLTFYGDASRTELLAAAGSKEAHLLIIAVENPDKTIEIAETASKYFPNLKIIEGRPGEGPSRKLYLQQVISKNTWFFGIRPSILPPKTCF